MKKTISVLTLLILCISIMVSSGCSKKDEPVNTQKERRIILGFSQVGDESEWRTANTKSIKEAAKAANIELMFSNAQQKQENQIKAIRGFIAQQVDVIAFSPSVETGWDSVLLEAKEAGIPVILTDRGVVVKDPSLWTTMIGSDFVEEGRKAAKWLVDELKYRQDDIEIVEIQGNVGAAPTIGRKNGFEQIIRDYPNFKIIKSQPGDFMLSRGKEIMTSFLIDKGNNIDVLFAHNDDMALGAIQAIEEYGLKPGEDIIIVSIDAVRRAFLAMMEGKLNCAVECNPLLGPQLMKVVKDIMKGKEVPKRIITEEGIFPEEVAEEEFPNRKY